MGVSKHTEDFHNVGVLELGESGQEQGGLQYLPNRGGSGLPYPIRPLALLAVECTAA